MTRRGLSLLAAFAVCAAQAGISVGAAHAHPHVWVTVESTALVGADAAISGIRHKWTFDELYSSFAIQGLDKKGGNNPTRDELKELAQLNIESLKEFGYFTTPQSNGEKIAIKPPVDYYLEVKDGLLSLFFTLPLEKPVPGKTAPLGFTVADPSYFIAFQFAKEKPFSLADGAPAECTIGLGQQGKEAEADKLADALSKTLGPGSGTVSDGSVVVACGGKK